MKNTGDHAIMMRNYLLCLIGVQNNVNYASIMVRNYLLFPITERTVVASPPRAVLAAPEADPDRLAEAPIDGEVPPRTPHSPPIHVTFVECLVYFYFTVAFFLIKSGTLLNL